MRFISLIDWVGLVGPAGLVHLVGLFGLVGLVGLGCQVRLTLGIFLLFYLIHKYFQKNNPKEFDDPQFYDGIKVISNESMDFNDEKNSMIPKSWKIQGDS